MPETGPNNAAAPKRNFRELAARAFRGTEEFAERLGVMASWAVWPVFYAIALGSSAWALTHGRATVLRLADNSISYEQRVQLAVWVSAALGVVTLCYVSVGVVQRWRSGRWNGMAAVGTLNRRLVGLLALPFVVAIAKRGIEQSEPIWTLLLTVVAATLIAASVYALPILRERDEEVPVAPGWRDKLSPWATALVLMLLWLAYGYVLSHFAITNHHGFNTRTTDLGYYDNIFYQSLHGRPLGCTFIKGGTHTSGHFDPILVLLSPLYMLRGNAELLLMLQSVWLGAGVVPIYLIAKNKLQSRGAGLVMAIAYAIYPALHGANMYEFHSLTLITPLVLWLLHFLELRRFKSYAAMLLLLCLVREDVALLLCFVGLYGVISGRPALRRAGLFTIMWCIVYYLTVKNVFMASNTLFNSGSKGAYSYEYYFRDLIPHKKGVLGLALTIVSNPIYVLKKSLGDPLKQQFLLLLFVPLGLLPFFARRARVMMLYGLLVAMFASRKPVFQVGFQYACLIFPVAFAIAPEGLRQLGDTGGLKSVFGLERRRFTRAALGFVLAASALVSWKFGVFFDNQAFRGGFTRIVRPPLDQTKRDRLEKVRAMIAQIPPGASVTTTNRLGAWVSNRKDVYFYHQKKVTHFVFADEREIKKGAKLWHAQRLRTGELIELDRVGTWVLWRVDPRHSEASLKAYREARARQRKTSAKSPSSANPFRAPSLQKPAQVDPEDPDDRHPGDPLDDD